MEHLFITPSPTSAFFPLSLESIAWESGHSAALQCENVTTVVSGPGM